jgi:hypothetical protein
MSKMKICLMLGAGVLFALSASAGAYDVYIPNAGFEERENFDPFPESTDKYNQWARESWRHFEVDNNGGPIRIWNPGVPGVDETPQGVLDVGFGGNAPEGKYVALVRSRYNDNEMEEIRPIRDWEAAAQILEETFDPTLTYTLTAQVGNLLGSVNYTPDYHGYLIQLAVGGTNVGGSTYQGRVEGGTVIAEDASMDVPVDGFVTATVEYTPDPANDYLAGQPLQIRLAALECNRWNHRWTGWVAFDDVKLTAIPEPMTLSLLGLGGLGLIRRRRR